MKRNVVYAVIGGCLIGASWLTVGKSVVTGDWSNKPNESYLEQMNSRLEVPPRSSISAGKYFSRGTYMGISRDVATDLGAEAATAYFSSVANRRGWTTQVDQLKADGRLLIFCDGRFAHRLEIKGRAKRALIHTSTYWHTNVESPLYCPGAKKSQE